MTARNKQQLVRAIRAAVAAQVPYAVIGTGNNILVSDAGFRGLLIRNVWRQAIRVRGVDVTAPAGAPPGLSTWAMGT